MLDRSIEPPAAGAVVSHTLSSSLSRDRTLRACRRCQRQKLKCDTEKPCILCRRAGVECEASGGIIWKTQLQSSCPRTTRKRKKRKQVPSEVAEDPDERFIQSTSSSVEAEHPKDCVPHAGTTEPRLSGSPDSSYLDSSTLDLVKEAFDFHQSDDLATSITSSLPRGQFFCAAGPNDVVEPSPQIVKTSRVWKNRNRASLESSDRHNHGFSAIPLMTLQRQYRTVIDLLDVLPKEQQAVDLLIDTYFDRVHWFTLVFHQDIFRERFRTLVSRPDIQAANSNRDFSFACTVLIVTVMGLHYTCDYRKQRLTELGVESEALLSRLLPTIQTVLFELVAIGSLESVQVCVLLGSFYLFHGCPGPALPIISCGLRIAQVIGLHRRKTSDESKTLSRQDIEERNRCWLALFEIDRFCSMVYGLPISFANEDCDLDPLGLPPTASQSQSSPMSIPFRNSSLLFYKRHMSEFSAILTEILAELYRPNLNENKAHIAPVSQNSQILELSKKINCLDKKLRNWYKGVHTLLQLDDVGSKRRVYASSEAMDQDIGGQGERFERHVLRMQAITIKFAFENAIIITHRPLLSFRSARSFQNEHSNDMSRTPASNPYETSIETCRKAALNTATIGSFSVFEEALDTYAASFFGIHVFTAGVVLCLIASFEPMAAQTHEVKAGIQKLIAMQRKLQTRSVIAAQGLEILEKIVSLVIERELQEMLGDSRPEDSWASSRNGETQLADNRRDIPHQVHIPDISDIENQTIGYNQSSLGVDSCEQADMQDSFPPQFQTGIDSGLLNHISTDLADDGNYIMDDYQYHLGDFSSDIEQGWIWNPTWSMQL